MIDLTEQNTYADEQEIKQLLNAVLQRYAVLFPDYEVSTVSLQKSSDRNEQLDCMIASLQKMKTLL